MPGAQTGIKNPSSHHCILNNLELLNIVSKYFIAWCILEENLKKKQFVI